MTKWEWIFIIACVALICFDTGVNVGREFGRPVFVPYGHAAVLNTRTGHLCAPRELQAPPPAYSDVPPGYTVLPPADTLPVYGAANKGII